MKHLEEALFNKYGKLKKIGEGSSRLVYQLTEKLVIKIAKNKKGIIQNKNEYLSRNKNNYALVLNQEMLLSEFFEAIIMEYLQPCDKFIENYIQIEMNKSLFNLEMTDIENFLVEKDNNNYSSIIEELVINSFIYLSENFNKFSLEEFEIDISAQLLEIFKENVDNNDIWVGELHPDNIGVESNNSLKIIDGGVISEDYFN